MIRLAVRVQQDAAEAVLAELLELAPSGMEQVDHDDGTVEYAIYGPPGELPSLPHLRAAAAGSLLDITTSELPDDWHERWRQFHKPVLIEAPSGLEVPSVVDRRLPALHVRAPWQPKSSKPGAIEIEIDPGQAFGTGAHDTTRLCLQLLLSLAAETSAACGGAVAAGGAQALDGEETPAAGGSGVAWRGARVLDVGTGSGVLAIAAAKLGFSPVIAFDSERESVEAAKANARVNEVEIEVTRLDLRRDPLPCAAGSIVLANLLAPLLIELSKSLQPPPAKLIAGGLLTSEADQVAAAFAPRAGLSERQRVHSGGWTALLLAGC